jgi:hypothetical protein
MGYFTVQPATTGGPASSLDGRGFFGPAPLPLPVGPPPAGSWSAQAPIPLFGGVTEAVAGSTGLIVAASGDAQSAISSDDGISWTAGTSGLGPGNGGNGAAFDSGKFIFASANGVTARTSSSADGLTWVASSTPFNAASNYCTALCSNGAGLVFAGLAGTQVGGNYFTSTDQGQHWTQRTGFTNTGWGNTVTQHTILWDGTRFVALGKDGSGHVQIAHSSDGIAWTQDGAFGSFFNASIAFTQGLYFCSLGNNTLVSAASLAALFSATPANTGLPNNIVCLFADHQRMFAFDDHANCVSSTDGVIFTPENIGFPPSTVPQSIVQNPVSHQLVALAGNLSDFPGNAVSTRNLP